MGVCVYKTGATESSNGEEGSSGDDSSGLGRKRRHAAPWYFLAGLGAFAVGYVPAALMAPIYGDYNPNANRAGAIPIAGPFMVRNALSDYNLNQGWNVAAIASGVLQIAGAVGLVSGTVAWVVGEPAPLKYSGTLTGSGTHWAASVGPEGAGFRLSW